MKVIDYARCKPNPISSHLDNLIHKHECKYHEYHLENENVKDKALKFNYPDSSKNYEKEFHEDLNKRFPNTYKLCEGDIKEFALILQNIIYSYEYMDD